MLPCGGMVVPVPNAPGATTAHKRGALPARSAMLGKARSVVRHPPRIALQASLVPSLQRNLLGALLICLAVQAASITLPLYLYQGRYQTAVQRAYLVQQDTSPSQHRFPLAALERVDMVQLWTRRHAPFFHLHSTVKSAQ